jgi:restriction endonuclease BglII
VAVIVTRASNLQIPWGPKVGNKYGASTTHMEKLLPRIEGGGGGGCPILAFGITSAKYVEDNAPIAAGEREW